MPRLWGLAVAFSTDYAVSKKKNVGTQFFFLLCTFYHMAFAVNFRVGFAIKRIMPLNSLAFLGQLCECCICGDKLFGLTTFRIYSI